MCLSDEFIRQGGNWVDVPSQKTEVVSGVLCLAMFVCFRSGRKCKLFNCYFRALYRERSSTINISPNCDRSGDSTERFPHYRQSHRNGEGSNVQLKDYIKFL